MTAVDTLFRHMQQAPFHTLLSLLGIGLCVLMVAGMATAGVAYALIKLEEAGFFRAVKKDGRGVAVKSLKVAGCVVGGVAAIMCVGTVWTVGYGAFHGGDLLVEMTR